MPVPIPIPDHGLSRPFLFLGKQSNYTPGSGGAVTTWERDWRLLTGWRRWLLVAGAIHASFTDLALLAGPGLNNRAPILQPPGHTGNVTGSGPDPAT